MFYMDLSVNGSTMQFTNSIPVITRLMKVLHGYFGQNPGLFAIAFPDLRVGGARHPGNRIRVFAKDRDHFDGLVEWLENNDRIAPYVNRGFAKRVDESKVSEWVEYRRYRIPSEKSSRTELREKRLEKSSAVPFMRIVSSSGHAFSMHIEAIKAEKCEGFTPTSYGLSGVSRFALPIVKDNAMFAGP